MIINHTKPDIYNLYRQKFGSSIDWEKGCIIAYDHQIYCITTPSPDEIEHELVHIRQQDDVGLDLWVSKYINDGPFRLSQEVEAYQRQANYLRESSAPRSERIWKVKAMAKLLSGPMYGNLISFSEALNLLK